MGQKKNKKYIVISLLGVALALILTVGLYFHTKHSEKQNFPQLFQSQGFAHELSKVSIGQSRTGLNRVSGLRITAVHEDGLFKTLGLETGDLIIKSGENVIDQKIDLISTLNHFKASKNIELTVIRDRQQIIISKVIN